MKGMAEYEGREAERKRGYGKGGIENGRKDKKGKGREGEKRREGRKGK